MSADARWWHDSPAAYEIKLAMGTAICNIDRVSDAAREGDSSAITWCETVGWDFVIREGL